MGSLIYIITASLDGYIADKNGDLDWGEPSEEVFKFLYNLIRPAGTYLYGRKMYKTMQVWETDPNLASRSPIEGDFAQMWQAANKIVYSKTLKTASTKNTRIERNFDPEAIRHLKETSASEINIGGTELAAEAFRSGLVDECYLFFKPVILGAGKQGLPVDVQVKLELLEERRFGDGTVLLRYKPRQEKTS